jgi:hypothetical protein
MKDTDVMRPQLDTAPRNNRRRQSSPQHRTEVDLMVECAHAWIPYGGPPAEDIMEQFGMTENRFFEVLLAIVQQDAVPAPVATQLRQAYPQVTHHARRHA